MSKLYEQAIGEEMKKDGWRVGQPMFVSKGRISLSASEKKVTRKIKAMNKKIWKMQERIVLLQKQIKEQTDKREEWQSICPHPSTYTEFGPEGKTPPPHIVKSACCLCHRDFTKEAIKEALRKA